MTSKFQKYFNDYCEHSSIIGFNYVAEKRSRAERILWIVLIAIAMVLSIYFIKEQYDKYDENPFIVSLATRETAIYTIPFPAITICPFTKSNKSKYNYTNVVHRLWDNLTVSKLELETTQYMMTLCSEDGIAGVNECLPQNDSFTSDFYNTIDKIDSTGDLIDDFFCSFMGVEYSCTDLFPPIMLDGGVCYTFNMLNRNEIFKPKVFQFAGHHMTQPKSDWTNDDGYKQGSGKDAYPHRALQSGADNSLQLYITANSKDTDFMCFSDVGYSISVHTPNIIPLTKKEFYVLPLDSAAQIIVHPELMTTSTTVKNYRTEDRKCYFSDERQLEYFQSYTQENCYLECLTNFTLAECSCVNFFMPHENATEICGNNKTTCMEIAEDTMKMAEIETHLGTNQEESYTCNCLPLCTQLKYQTYTSRYPWMWREFFNAHKKMRQQYQKSNTDLDQLHVSSLRVFFKSDQFFATEKTELYGIFDFISNFGGLLGLFTGFSLLTAAEIVYYLSVRLWCNKRLYDDVSGPPDENVISLKNDEIIENKRSLEK